MLTTRRIDGLQGLRDIRDAWLSLHPNAPLYARHEWHLAIAMHLIESQDSLAYLQVLDGSRTVAIVPVIGSRSPIPVLGNRRVLSLGLHPHLGLADLPLAADAPLEDVMRAVMQALRKWPVAWDVIYWPRVLSSSHALRLARTACSPGAHVSANACCNGIDTSRPYAEVLAGLSKNLQVNLRKSLRRIADSGGAAVSTDGVCTSPVGTGEGSAAVGERLMESEAAFETFLALEASGWKGAAGTRSAIRFNARTRAFYAELLAQRGPGFLPEITLLIAAGRPLAGQFSITVNGQKEMLKIGYDERESRCSPGQVLIANSIQAACENSLRRVSFVTDMAWHTPWRPLAEPTFGIVLFRTRRLAAVHDLLLALRRAAKPAVLAARRTWARAFPPGGTGTTAESRHS